MMTLADAQENVPNASGGMKHQAANNIDRQTTSSRDVIVVTTDRHFQEADQKLSSTFLIQARFEATQSGTRGGNIGQAIHLQTLTSNSHLPGPQQQPTVSTALPTHASVSPGISATDISLFELSVGQSLNLES